MIKNGDIVRYKNFGRIGNGLYGSVLEYKGILILLDNEGAPEIWGIGKKDEEKIEVVGTQENSLDLLNVWWKDVAHHIPQKT